MALTQVQSGMLTGNSGSNPTATAVGNQALNSNTATVNTAVGYQAGYSTTTGDSNTYLGETAGYTNSTGNRNTFLGRRAGYTSNLAGTQQNTFVGWGSGQDITSGSKNSILGSYSGNQGGLDIRTTSNNIVLSDGDGNPRFYFDNSGTFAGSWVVNQTSAGYWSNMYFKNQTGQYFQIGTQSGTSPAFVVYNPSGGGVYLGYSASAWTGISDERLKNITGEISDGLNKVNQLRAAKFTWKRDETNEAQVGLIAQDVQAVLPEAVSENDGNLGVRYTEVIPLLVAAIKELNAKVDAQAVEIAALKAAK